MADKEIINLPPLGVLTDDTLIPVYQPGSPSPAQRMTGKQFSEFAEAAARAHAQAAEASKKSAAASAQSAASSASSATAAAKNANQFSNDAAAAKKAAESAKAAAEAARDQAHLAVDKDLTDMDDGGKAYFTGLFIKNGHPVLILTEKVV